MGRCGLGLSSARQLVHRPSPSGLADFLTIESVEAARGGALGDVGQRDEGVAQGGGLRGTGAVWVRYERGAVRVQYEWSASVSRVSPAEGSACLPLGTASPLLSPTSNSKDNPPNPP